MKKLYSLLALSLLFAGASAQDPVRYTVEKDIIHSYLTDFDYDTIPLTVQRVMGYFNIPHVTDASKPATDPVNRLDAPAPYRITWTHQDGADAQRVDVGDDVRLANRISFTVNKDSSAYDLYNMMPGKRVYYKVISVKDDVETTVAEGSLLPEGMLRWIYAEGTWNVRDMGGWIGLGGNPIKYGKLFRGGQLTNPKDPYNVLLTANGIEAMRNAGIRAELDLRSSGQAHYNYASFAIKENNKYDADFTNIATTSARMWQFDKDDSNIKAIKWVISELKAGKPVFYHCQNGADRTGTIGFLIGALLGMSESDLAKDYELTTFCQEAAVAFDPTEVGFARLRNYEGKKGSIDNSSDPKDYMFAPLIDKLNGISGSSIQRKIYNFFKTGKNGNSISANDLIWFINYMTGYTVVDDITNDLGTLVYLDKRQQVALNAKTYPENPTNGTITYSSSDTTVATVNSEGIITAWTSGEATIYMKADDCTKSTKVVVRKVESVVPDSVLYQGLYFKPKTPVNNKISDGSFEYGSYYGWKNGAGTNLTSASFKLTQYQEDQDSVYLESMIDGDETSEGSIRMEWITPKNRTCVLGFRIKNSTNLVTEHNPNLKIMMTTDEAADDDPNATILEVPSYNGEWTEVQFVFSTQKKYNRLRLIFTHLSQNGNNTCFDNFYLTDLDVATMIQPVSAQPEWAKAYDINGREVDNNTRGLKIINGRKVLISE